MTPEQQEAYKAKIIEIDSIYMHQANEPQFDHERVDISVDDICELIHSSRQGEIEALQSKLTQLATIILDYEQKWDVIAEDEGKRMIEFGEAVLKHTAEAAQTKPERGWCGDGETVETWEEMVVDKNSILKIDLKQLYNNYKRKPDTAYKYVPVVEEKQIKNPPGYTNAETYAENVDLEEYRHFKSIYELAIDSYTTGGQAERTRIISLIEEKLSNCAQKNEYLYEELLTLINDGK